MIGAEALGLQEGGPGRACEVGGYEGDVAGEVGGSEERGFEGHDIGEVELEIVDGRGET